VKKTNFPGLDIVPANLELQEYEYDTPLALSKNDGSMGRIFFGRLDDALADVADNYDVVVIDCPPQLGYLTMTAISSSTDSHHRSPANAGCDVDAASSC
jgi:chromosome partitioning protein